MGPAPAAQLGKEAVGGRGHANMDVDAHLRYSRLDRQWSTQVHLCQKLLADCQQRGGWPRREPVGCGAGSQRGEAAAALPEGPADRAHGQDAVQVVARALQERRVASILHADPETPCCGKLPEVFYKPLHNIKALHKVCIFPVFLPKQTAYVHSDTRPDTKALL